MLGDFQGEMKISHLGLAFQGVEALGTGQQHINGFLQPRLDSPEKPAKPVSKRKRSTNNEDPPSPTKSRPPRSRIGQIGGIEKTKGKGKGKESLGGHSSMDTESER